MTNGILDNPKVGDLVMDYAGDLGIVSLIEYWGDENGTDLYFVHWTSGGLAGYTTAHKPKDIRMWTINVRLQLDKL